MDRERDEKLKAWKKGAIVGLVCLILVGGIFSASNGFATSDTVRAELTELVATNPPPTEPPPELECVEYAMIKGAGIEDAEEECKQAEIDEASSFKNLTTEPPPQIHTWYRICLHPPLLLRNLYKMSLDPTFICSSYAAGVI